VSARARGCLLPLLASLLATTCGGEAKLPLSAGIGPHPALPSPEKRLLPVLDVAPAEGWPAGSSPVPAEDLAVTKFADRLDHPRWLYVLPDGGVLVAETNAPPRPEDAKGLRGWMMRRVMKRTGAAAPSANRITLLRDGDGDGVAETRSTFLANLNAPFGMALVGGDFYVADTDALLRFPYARGADRIEGSATELTALPAGPINHHWTKNLIASTDGKRLYVAVGSNSNAAENGIDVEAERAAIWEVDPRTGAHRVFASGLRNPVGMAWEPETGALWTAVNERDELGSDLVPDYMTAVRDGAFYGWPFSYYGGHVDDRVKPQRPDLVARALVPDYALGAHTASLGLAASRGPTLPPRFRSGMFVGQHGSWNRKPLSGYKVIFVPFRSGQPSGEPLDVLGGFVSDRGTAHGRPVGVALDRHGALLVADDVGNAVWRVTALSPPPARAVRAEPRDRRGEHDRADDEARAADPALGDRP
jgi:glucose/arabinose dehydrogenase